MENNFRQLVQKNLGYIPVKNLNGTSDNLPVGFNSWLEYWSVNTNNLQLYNKGINFTCANLNCNETAVDGAHVQIVDSEDKTWYIIPLCRKCNKRPSTENFFIRNSKVLVPANINNLK